MAIQPVESSADSVFRSFQREMEVLGGMRESHNERSLHFKYEVGTRISAIVDDAGRWDSSGNWIGTKEDAVKMYGSRTLEEAAAASGWDVEQLRACARLYRAWNPLRFNQLIAIIRSDGSHMFTYRVMQRLQTAKLTPEQRTALEDRMIQTAMSGDEFIAEIGRLANHGKQRRARPVNDQEVAVRRFSRVATSCLQSFSLVSDFQKAVKVTGEIEDDVLKREIKTNKRAMIKLLKDLQVHAERALKKLTQE